MIKLTEKKIILVTLCMLLQGLTTRQAKAHQINGIEVEVLGGLSETYDDNITFSKDDAIKDFITSISPGISAKYSDDKKSWSLSTNVTEEVFAENGKYTNTSEYFAADSKIELTKYDRFSMKDAFSHTYEPAGFPDAFERITGRYGYYLNNFNIEYNRDLGKRLDLKASYGNELDAFSRQDLSDSYVNNTDLTLDYALSSAAKIAAAYDFMNRKFHPGDDASDNTLSLALTNFLTKQLSLETKAGVDFISAYNDNSYSKPLISATLTDEIDQRTSASLVFLKEYSTNPYTQDLFNKWEVSAYFARELLKNLSFSVSSFYGNGKYINLDTRDALLGGEVALTYNLKKNLKADLAYSYSKVNSNDPTREYSKNKISLGLKMDF